MAREITIIGAGLAGCEAALFLARHGWRVTLHEQKPALRSPAHRLAGPAELVCSNSLKSLREDTASGLYKMELKLLGSSLLPLAEECALPAGAALAVDPEMFSEAVRRALVAAEGISIVPGGVSELPTEGVTLVATGPLTGAGLAEAIDRHFGASRSSFYDAIAPSVTRESLVAGEYFQASRYDKGEADYLNATLNREQYREFVEALSEAEAVPAHPFEEGVPYFESCLPVEVIASRGPETLRFGPFRPVGLRDPATDCRPWAVLQLRRENREGSVWGLVGCQTKLRHGDQKRIFGIIPALAEAEYVRYGAMHRNYFLDFPATLTRFQESRHREGLLFAGQMTGVEGYVESMGSGLLAARHILHREMGIEPTLPPATTITGALAGFLEQQEPGRSQPMNVAFGLLPTLEGPRLGKRERKGAYAARALAEMKNYLSRF